MGDVRNATSFLQTWRVRFMGQTAYLWTATCVRGGNQRCRLVSSF